MDRVRERARSFGRFLKEPIRLRDVLVGVAVVAGLFLAFQLPYFVEHVKYLASAIPDIDTADDTSAPDRLRIPKIGVTAPLVYIESDAESRIQRALERGVVHYAGTALPGEYGNAYFVGHSSDLFWKGGEYKTVFALLPYLEPGDAIYASDADGIELKYRVLETRVVRPSDFSVLDQRGHERRLLTLQTSYPVGTAISRFIVLAELEAEP